MGRYGQGNSWVGRQVQSPWAFGFHGWPWFHWSYTSTSCWHNLLLEIFQGHFHSVFRILVPWACPSLGSTCPKSFLWFQTRTKGKSFHVFRELDLAHFCKKYWHRRVQVGLDSIKERVLTTFGQFMVEAIRFLRSWRLRWLLGLHKRRG